MSSPTIAFNGQLLFPHIGSPPETPVGYSPTNNPYIFNPILKPCVKRDITMKITRCCGRSHIMTCKDRVGVRITKRHCKICQDQSIIPKSISWSQD
jgi:hypothetical protein